MQIDGRQVSVMAQIITCNPDMDILRENVRSIISQVDALLIYDNGSANIKAVVEGLQDYNCVWIKNTVNMGIGEALYDGINYAYKQGYKYIYTLDDDTVSNYDVVKLVVSELEKDDSLAIIAAGTQLRLDEDFSKNSYESKIDYVTKERGVMTAGSCARVEYILNEGNYKKEWFIDWIDWEMCNRLIKRGYKVALHRGAAQRHAEGNKLEKKFFGKNVISQDYPAFRLYYRSRNLVLLRALNMDDEYYRKRAFKSDFSYRIKCILAIERNKIKKLTAILRGIINGKKMLRTGKTIPYSKKFPY